MPHRPKLILVDKKAVGRRLRDLRESRNITQVELAALLGVDQSNVSAIERARRSLTIHQVVRIAQALRVSTDAILMPAPAKRRGPADRFLERLQRLETLPAPTRRALYLVLDSLLGSRKSHGA